ncbi:AAA family ATPase [Planomonospora sp. ID67723]|uniref:AAA family ATPase n=1 Tax=Planomonospora sp. ID67723 TaxID=2738134 RepID=UPI0018C42A02|nr:AAA family ATPase [Planomonospora sp. ID67723]MBG0826602.1 AAA family ATPase [Planomonospora sp. ID67723]
MLVVLVNGLPGSGKTTLAKALAHAFGLPLLSKDRIKETLADTLGTTAPPGMTDRRWSRKLGAAAGETPWALLADTKHGAVLESPWLANLRPIVVAGLQKAGVTGIHEVWCDVPVPLARRRYEERSADRHPVHHDSRVDDQQWAEWARQAEPLALGPVHRVNAALAVDVTELAEQIRRMTMADASGGDTPAPG